MAQPRTNSVSAAELETYLAGITFPANKDDIMRHVTHEGAPSKVVEMVGNAPNKTYDGIADLAVGMSLNRH